MQMKVSDYVVNFFSEKGVTQCFCVTGGGAMHLNDSMGRASSMKVVYNHHEQACAMAAEGFARVAKLPAIVSVTSGPGALNAITGVFGAYTDSIPMIVISGQMKSTTLKTSDLTSLRYLGFQEANIIPIVAEFTKYARLINKAEDIFFHLEAAWDAAMSGRKGPIWLDIPIDIQAEIVEVPDERLSRYVPSKDMARHLPSNQELISVTKLLMQSKRPVLMIGDEFHSIENGEKSLKHLINSMKIPVVTEWNAHDLVSDNSPYYCGRPGTIGDRGGNYVIQSSDLVIAIGCQLSLRQISFEWDNFAKDALLIYVTCDVSELQKKTLNVDLPIHADVSLFANELSSLPLNGVDKNEWARWLVWSKEIHKKYPVCQEKFYNQDGPLNAYPFFNELSELVINNTKVVLANGAACVVGLQAFKFKKAVRLFTNAGASSMGYGIAASIGAAIASEEGHTICVEGDGSIMMNLHELQTIIHNKLPIKIFILNNAGYHSIKQTQKNIFNAEEDGYFGADHTSGLGLPNFEGLSGAFGYNYHKIESLKDLRSTISSVLSSKGFNICEVFIDPHQDFEPKLVSKMNADGTFYTPSLEYMSPFLDETELKANEYPKTK